MVLQMKQMHATQAWVHKCHRFPMWAIHVCAFRIQAVCQLAIDICVALMMRTFITKLFMCCISADYPSGFPARVIYS